MTGVQTCALPICPGVETGKSWWSPKGYREAQRKDIFTGFSAGVFFRPGHSGGSGAFALPPARAEQGVFWLDGFSHAVSAFCNAGFALYPGSMTRYADNFSVNIVLMTLIICGGLGFYVLVGLPGFFRRAG